ncbi:ATP-binding cassette domain-containing protein [Candidatus Foliamicus sp.]
MKDIPPLMELEGIERRHTGKRGRSVVALQAVSLKLYAGEFVCITGPSGSGKSTLMNILGCLDRADSGTYRFAGREVHLLGRDGLAWLRCKAFGFVFQDYSLLGSSTARENVEMPGIYAGLTAATRQTRALGLLAALGIQDRMDHRPAALSGGEQQRVSIARALMNGGSVILADEPTGSLDSASGEKVLRLLKELSRKGHTIILISHNPEIATAADRRIALQDGRIVSDSGTKGARQIMRAASESAPISQPAMAAIARLTQSFRSGVASLPGNLLGTHRVRAVLTVCSILLGVWAVVTMLSVAEGMFRETLERVSRLGADRIEVRPYGKQGDSAIALTLQDAEIIARQIPNVRRVAPALTRQFTVRYGTKSVEAFVESYLVFTPAAGIDNDAPVIERGNFISQRNNEQRDQVTVLGWGIADELFPSTTDPFDQYVMIDAVPFRVIGVLAGREAFADVPSWLSQQEGRRSFIPYRTAAAMLYGTGNPSKLDILIHDPLEVDATNQAIRELLIRQHGSEGFRILFLEARAEQVSETRALLWLGLGSIGGIALFGGGMGVMAIMLMVITERTREIGIRMAVGARRRDITEQFLLEAVALTAVGGLLGLLASWASGPLIEYLGLPIVFSPWIVIVALACTVGIGLVFGIVPAQRAARLDPVAALAARG